MPLYLCRWPNGDCSAVQAANKGAAIEILDEAGNAEGCPITLLRDFMAHFRLTDHGTLEMECFGEATEDAVFEIAYPILNETFPNVPEDAKSGVITEEGETLIRDAVIQERKRVCEKKVNELGTELGKRIKAETDAPTRVVERIIRKRGQKVLGQLDPRSKPN